MELSNREFRALIYYDLIISLLLLLSFYFIIIIVIIQEIYKAPTLWLKALNNTD